MERPRISKTARPKLNQKLKKMDFQNQIFQRPKLKILAGKIKKSKDFWEGFSMWKNILKNLRNSDKIYAKLGAKIAKFRRFSADFA